VPNSTTPRRIVANRLLSALSAEDYEGILADLKAVPLKYRVSLHEPGDRMPYIYFPNTGVISMLTVMEDGNAVEIATIGNEGLADLFTFFGLEESDSRLLIQVPGTAMRMESRSLRCASSSGTTPSRCLRSSRNQRRAIACIRWSNAARAGF
jgi:hypothetical protein